MHGRRRAETKALKRDPKVAAKLSKKATLWYQLQNELLKRRREFDEYESTSSKKNPDEEEDTSKRNETLSLIENALSVNPDPLWLWNFRRDLIQSFSWETESAFTQTALESNPKAYGAWHYRKWCLTQISDTSILSNELSLTKLFLQRDERNFHCWSYRRFVVSCLLHNDTAAKGIWQCDGVTYMGAQIGDDSDTTTPILAPPDRSILEGEWEFTNSKIRDNFSNFSAFHYRSKLLPILKKDLQEEFATIENAICTEPDDQTAWWYQSFLFEYASESVDSMELVRQSILPNHIDLMRELQEETENKSKWVLLGLFKTLSFLDETQDTKKEQRELLCTLEEMDSDRKMRYKHLRLQLDGSNVERGD